MRINRKRAKNMQLVAEKMQKTMRWLRSYVKSEGKKERRERERNESIKRKKDKIFNWVESITAKKRHQK